MRRTRSSLLVCAAVFGVLLAYAGPIHAVEFITNGTFEGGSYTSGDDTVPTAWAKYETGLIGETSVISISADNGPSVSGSSSANFVRSSGGVDGDWTTIRQDLDIWTSSLTALTLSIDVKALSHDLCGGGWAGAWEYPITAAVRFQDSSSSVNKWAQIGWYITWGGACDATADWKWWLTNSQTGAGRWARSSQVTADTWYSQTIDLLDPRLDIQHIDQIRVGGAGWNYEGRADNVSLQGTVIPEPATCALLATGLAGLGLWRRRESR